MTRPDIFIKYTTHNNISRVVKVACLDDGSWYASSIPVTKEIIRAADKLQFEMLFEELDIPYIQDQ